ncbi:unknown protein [Parachlamydia acanthamoebae UV-7]|uniref:Uncharacterized protein n=1 Tax=Parachlamydia acanthamoebae (strain UV7) TaxID=765952 RepID=F8L0B9_PARAV|nr:unknown protein [Parachlamydia acanthamoebae UV-7]
MKKALEIIQKKQIFWKPHPSF